jgi:hypothetical protein
MTKKRPRTAWPAELDEPSNLNLPIWKPKPWEDMDGYLAWGEALQEHHAKCDRLRADEADRLLELWLKYLKIKNSEGAREVLLRIAELEDRAGNDPGACPCRHASRQGDGDEERQADWPADRWPDGEEE